MDNDTGPNIKHIVISGGGSTGFIYYGILKESHNNGFWNINNIQTMYGVSCGSILIFILGTVKYIGWDDSTDYIVKRPWEELISPENIFNAYSNVGICNRDLIIMVCEPILSALDLSLNITLQQFYDFNGIEMHFYTARLDTYELVDISYKTHPDWELVDAIYSSSALPVMFKPCCINGITYTDGGLLCNYPLKQCIEQVENPDEILGINKKYIQSPNTSSETDYKNIIEYLMYILKKTMSVLEKKNSQSDIIESKYTIDVYDYCTNAWDIYNAIKTKENRLLKVEHGRNIWQEYKNKIGLER
jgi:predicted acylesterase/phospholipase RssA